MLTLKDGSSIVASGQHTSTTESHSEAWLLVRCPKFTSAGLLLLVMGMSALDDYLAKLKAGKISNGEKPQRIMTKPARRKPREKETSVHMMGLEESLDLLSANLPGGKLQVAILHLRSAIRYARRRVLFVDEYQQAIGIALGIAADRTTNQILKKDCASAIHELAMLGTEGTNAPAGG